MARAYEDGERALAEGASDADVIAIHDGTRLLAATNQSEPDAE